MVYSLPFRAGEFFAAKGPQLAGVDSSASATAYGTTAYFRNSAHAEERGVRGAFDAPQVLRQMNR
jgi:hypothetical protein